MSKPVTSNVGCPHQSCGVSSVLVLLVRVTYANRGIRLMVQVRAEPLRQAAELLYVVGDGLRVGLGAWAVG